MNAAPPCPERGREYPLPQQRAALDLKNTPFNIEDKYDCHPEDINTALSEATLYLDNQVASISATRQHATMLITVLSAVMAACVGIIFLHPESMTHCLTLLLLSLIPLSILIRGIFYNRRVFHSGCTPANFLLSSKLTWAKSVTGNLDEASLLKLLHLKELQYRILMNKETHGSLVRYYRTALIIMLSTYWIALLVFAAIAVWG